MKTVSVKLKQYPYQIKIGENCLSQLGAELKKLNIGCDAVIITNPSIHKLHGKALRSGLKKAGFSIKVLEVPDGEKSKSAKQALNLIDKIARYDVYKKIFVIAFGGGVVGDLAGYVSAAYKRGIPFVQVPTTFLAQIDSSIGGKVGIDLPVGKNLVGAFYQPKLVFSDVAVLKTLPVRQMRNGMAEAIKYGIIYDANFFEYLEKNSDKVLAADISALKKSVEICSHIKTEVVLADEKETKGIRTILNFGHTAGHAIEAAAGYNSYQHGEAIALGMRVATDLSVQLKLLKSKVDVERINALITQVGLPEKTKGIRLDSVMKLMKHDKKFITGKNRFVLIKKIGQTKVVEGVSESHIVRALKKFKA